MFYRHLCQDLILSGKQTYLGGVPPNMPPWVALTTLRHPTSGMVAYLVVHHQDMSVLTLPLNPDIYLYRRTKLFR